MTEPASLPAKIPAATGDWRDIRAAVLHAFPDFYQRIEPERQVIWKTAEAIAAVFPRLFARCIECDQQALVRHMFRCTDCGAWMCEDHWKRHFGPDHKPHGEKV